MTTQTIEEELDGYNNELASIEEQKTLLYRRSDVIVRNKKKAIKNAIIDGNMLLGTHWKLSVGGRSLQCNSMSINNIVCLVGALYSLELDDDITLHAYNKSELCANSLVKLVEFATKHGLIVDHSALNDELAKMKQVIAKLEEGG